jgi:uncharacterized protein YdaU (DUF1376 family)
MSLPWFKMYGSAFLVDTMRLSTEQKGAYLMLMLDYYDKEAPPPDDDAILSQITGLSLERWRVHRRALEPFFEVTNGLWKHARCDEELVSRQVKITANRENGTRPKRRRKATGQATGQASGQATGIPNGIANGVANDQANNEPDFGPSRASVTAPSHSDAETGALVPNDTQQEATGLPTGSAIGIPNGSQSLDKKKEVREGANAPSSERGFVGSLIDPAFMPTQGAIAEAINVDRIPSIELTEWLNDWKQRCMDAGTRIEDWHAAWAREYHRRSIERAKAKPKPRVSVSKKPKLTKIPDDWMPNASHEAIAKERGLDMQACIESFSDYVVTKHPDWRDADASFRNWLKSPHRTEFKNGKAQPAHRRAPAPGGSSIVDAFDRLDARIDAAAGRSFESGEPDGQEVILGLPEE